MYVIVCYRVLLCICVCVIVWCVRIFLLLLFAVGVVTRGCVVCVQESDPPIVYSPLFTIVITTIIITNTFTIVVTMKNLISKTDLS